MFHNLFICLLPIVILALFAFIFANFLKNFVCVVFCLHICLYTTCMPLEVRKFLILWNESYI